MIASEGGWGQKALKHARAIVEASLGRGSATAAEAQAAAYVRAQLSNVGVGDVRTQNFEGLRSIWFFLALTFGIALSGHAAFWLLRVPMGELAGAGVAGLFFGFCAYLLWRKFTFQGYPLQVNLPHGPSQNVIAVLPAEGETQKRVVLVAHLDSHRAVWWFASDALVKTYAFLSPLGVYGVLAAPLFYGLSAVSGLAVLSWLGAILALVHLLAWFTGMTADLGPYSPGANDNASSVGVVLALAEKLKDEPLKQTEVWLTFTGCEETGCDGMRAFMEENEAALSGALYVDFELVGIGERLVYLQSEGVVRRRRISPELERLVLEVGGEFGIEPIRGAGAGAFTEIGVVWERGLEGVCLLSLRRGSPLFPEWHRMTDTPDRLQVESLERVQRMGWALLKYVDEGEA
jgi:hypothetical protein